MLVIATYLEVISDNLSHVCNWLHGVREYMKDIHTVL